MRWTEAARVGLAIVLAAVAMLGVGLFVERNRFIRSTQTIEVVFTDVQGLTPGADVMMRGVRIGDVTGIVLDAEKRPLLTLKISSQFPVTRKDGFRIASATLSFAPPFVEMLPDANAGTPLESISSGPYIGTTETSAEEVFAQTRTLLENVNTLTQRVSDVVAGLASFTDDPAVREGFVESTKNFGELTETGVRIAHGMEATVANVQGLTEQFDSTAAQLDQALSSANALIAEFQSAAQNTQGITEDSRMLINEVRGVVSQSSSLVTTTQETVELTKTTVSTTNDRVAALFDTLDQSLTQLNATLTQAQDLIGDEESKESFKATLANLADATESLAAISGDAQKLTGDPAVQEDLKQTIAGLRDATTQAADTFRKVNDLLGGAKAKKDQLQQRSGGFSFNSEAIYATESERTRLDANMIVPWGDRSFFTAGLYDFGDGARINLQHGRQLATGANLRYGFYAGRLGLGVDLGPRTRPNLFVNVFGVRDPQIDARARLPLMGGLDVSFGLDDVTDTATPTVGLQYRR